MALGTFCSLNAHHCGANVVTDNEMKTATSSAPAKVFGTVELLEAILVQLPCKDLLLSQRVCGRWEETIAGSIKLQQALGLIAVANDDAPDDQTTSMPSLHTSAHDFLIDCKTDASNTLNPLLGWFFTNEDGRGPWLANFINDIRTKGSSKVFKDLTTNRLYRVLEDLAYKPGKGTQEVASYKAMTLFQPPATHLRLFINKLTDSLDTSAAYAEVIQEDRGVTIGDVVDVMEAFFDEDDEPFQLT